MQYICDASRDTWFRLETIAEAQAELAIIESYLPQMMSREKIQQHAEAVIAELGVSGMGAMGQVMGALMPRLEGQADGRDVSAVVRQLLQQ